MSKLIPKDFIRIAESEFRNNKSEIFFSKKRKLLLLVADDLPIGYIKPSQLESVLHCLKDVQEMKGRYHGPV